MLDQGRGAAETASAMRAGRSSLRIPVGTAGGLGFNSGRGASGTGTSGGAAAYRPGGGLGFNSGGGSSGGSGGGGGGGGGGSGGFGTNHSLNNRLNDMQRQSVAGQFGR
ncbi:MAG: hypothetical protein ACXIUZ_01970 [Lysobacteraceae bacterium]